MLSQAFYAVDCCHCTAFSSPDRLAKSLPGLDTLHTQNILHVFQNAVLNMEHIEYVVDL